jgi:hypothetical protein
VAEKNVKITYSVETTDLEQVIALFQKIAKNTEKSSNAVEELGKDAKKAGNQTEKALKEAAKEATNLSKATKTASTAMDGLGNTFKKIAGAAVAAFTIDAVLDLGKKIFNVTAEFQKFEAVLSNSLGSKSLAQAALVEIQEFAAKTPFSVRELTEAYVQLANRGIKPTTSSLTKIGDLASALGKPLQQVNEAILDVTNSERWTELGVKVKVNGDKIIGTFRGMTVEAEKSEAGALKMVEAFGEMKGVAGGMAAISATLEGKVSNMNDAFDTLFNTIGKEGAGIMGFATSELARYANQLTELIKTDATRQIESDNKALAAQVTEWEKLNLEQLKYIEKTKQRARLGAIMDNNAGGMLHSLTEEIHILEDLIKKREQLEGVTEKEVGLLQKLRREQSELTAERERATTEKEALSLTRQIELIQEKIKRLTTLGQAAKKAEVAMKNLVSVDFEQLKIDEANEKLEKFQKVASLIYKKIYGEQVTGEHEVIKSIEKRSDKFVERIDKEIVARGKAFMVKQTQDEFEDLRTKERYERNLQLAQDYTSAVQNLYSEVVNYQNQLDDQRLERLTANKEVELALAGTNAVERNKIEIEFDRKQREIRRKQAEREKRLAIFNAIINVAQGITAALSMGLPGIVLAVLVAAAGAVQIAAISSQQVPAYAKGTKGVKGKGNKDSEAAFLTPGEMVIPVATKKKYNPILNAIFDHKIDPKILNDIAAGRFGGSQLIINENKELIEELKKIQVNKFSFDEDGFTRYQEKGASRTKYLERKYRAK